MDVGQISEAIRSFSSQATLSNLISNKSESLICFIAERDEGRYRVRVKVDPAVESFDQIALAEDKIPISRPYRSTSSLYQISVNGVEVFIDKDRRLNRLFGDGSYSIISNVAVDHFSFIDPIDSMVAVVDERTIVRIELDGSVQELFRERSGGDYFVADPVASKDRDLVVFRFWTDSTMPFYESRLRAVSLSLQNEVELDLYPSPIYSQPQFSPKGKYFSYIAVVEDHLKIVLDDGGGNRTLVSSNLDQGDYDYGFGQRTYCYSEEADAIYCQIYSNGYSTLIHVDLETMKASELEYGHFDLPTAIKGGVVAIRSGARTPTNITAVRIGSTNDGNLVSTKDLIYNCFPMIQRELLSEPETFFVKSIDGEGNEYLINCHTYRASDEKGLMILIHGGPVGASKVTWNPKIPLLNELGISVTTFNQRGSSGYGHSFMLALNNGYAVVDVEDTLAVIEEVTSHSSSVVPIFISGGSAAGVVAIGVAKKISNQLQESAGESQGAHAEVRGLILNYPVVDITYVHNHTHRFEKSLFQYVIGDFPSMIEEYERRSPKSVDLSIPTLIIHGTDDKVVPIEAVIEYARNRPNVTLEVMEGYGHGFSDPEGQRRELELTASFIKNHLI